MKELHCKVKLKQQGEASVNDMREIRTNRHLLLQKHMIFRDLSCLGWKHHVQEFHTTYGLLQQQVPHTEVS
jgi:hypothetical protein